MMVVDINQLLEQMAVPLKSFVRKHIANEPDAAPVDLAAAEARQQRRTIKSKL